jgi:hypothetical protein
MMYRTAADCRRHDDVDRFAIFSVRNTNFGKIENQFSCPSLDVLFQILHCFVEKGLWSSASLKSVEHRNSERRAFRSADVSVISTVFPFGDRRDNRLGLGDKFCRNTRSSQRRFHPVIPAITAFVSGESG